MSEMPAVFRQITRTARKEHKCCECKDVIKPGDKYVYSSGIWSGEASDFKQCMICSEVSNAAAASVDDPEEGPAFTGLREWFQGYVCRDFQEETLVETFARDLKLDPGKIRHVLGNRFFD